MKRTYEEIEAEAIEMIENSDDLLVELVNELDNWDGYADGFRAYPMCEIDDFFTKPSELIEKLTCDFCSTDDYFYFSIYGLESTDNVADLYRDNVTCSELLTKVLDDRNHINIDNSDFEDLLDEMEGYEEETEENEETEN